MHPEWVHGPRRLVKNSKKTIQLSGSSLTNKQFPLFNGHDSHWDANALENLAKHHSEPFFLMAGNSTLDHHNDNDPNAALKACFNEVKGEWDENCVTTNLAPPHFNYFIVEAWRWFTQKAAPIVIRSFSKMNLFPYNNSAAGACTAVMQCSEEEKSIELEQMARAAINIQPFTIARTSAPMTILRAKGYSGRNLLIRSAAYKFLNKTLLLPSQEIRKVHQEHLEAKSTKIGSMEILEQDRSTNSDTSRGLWANLAICAQAGAVQMATGKKKEMDKIKIIETTRKNAA